MKNKKMFMRLICICIITLNMCPIFYSNCFAADFIDTPLLSLGAIYDSNAIYDPENNYIFISSNSSNKLFAIDTLSLTVYTRNISSPDCLFISDNKLFIGSSYNKKITVMDIGSLSIVKSFDVDGEFIDLLVGQDGYIYISTSTGMESYDYNTGEKIDCLNISGIKYIMHPSKEFIYTISNTGISQIPYNNGHFEQSAYKRIVINMNQKSTCTFSPDGKYIFENSGNIYIIYLKMMILITT